MNSEPWPQSCLNTLASEPTASLERPRRSRTAASLGLEAYPKAPPVFALNIDGHREIVHHLARITLVGLQQHRLRVLAAADPSWVVEQSLGAVLQHIPLPIAGQRLAKTLIVSRKVALLINRTGVNHLPVTFQYRFLQGRKMLVGKTVKGGVVFGWLCCRYRPILRRKQLLLSKFAFRQSLLQRLAASLGGLLRLFENKLIETTGISMGKRPEHSLCGLRQPKGLTGDLLAATTCICQRLADMGNSIGNIRRRAAIFT